MLKYHVAVCDDEKSDLDGIVQSVQRYDVQGCFDIETYMDGNELLSELQNFMRTYRRDFSRRNVFKCLQIATTKNRLN